MEMLWSKLIFAGLLFIIGFTSGLLPLRISLSAGGKKKLSCGNAFAGGIFLGAGLLHLLPDANENFKVFAGDIDFPFPALACGLGILLILLIEKAILNADEDDVGELSQGKSFYPYMLCIILSIHSVIAGISLGLEAAMASSIAIFVALIAHKGAAAFALGVSLRSADFANAKHRSIVGIFAIMTPLGVLLGMGFSALLSGKPAAGVEALFDALAAGTFIYVALIDIIEDVFSNSDQRGLKMLLITTGFALMAAIAIWT